MNHPLYLAITFLYFSITTSVLGQDVYLNSQDEVDAFDQEVVNGDLIIRGRDVKNLDGLFGLERVEGSLRFPGLLPALLLEDIDGLSTLLHVGKNLELRNLKVSDLTGLKSLKTVSGKLSIIHLRNLQDLSGLERLDLTTVDSLVISSNQNLTSLNGLNLSTRIQHIVVSDCPLQNVDVFNTVETIEGSMTMTDLDRIQNIDGLSNLSELKGILSISNLHNLVDISGLANITQLDGLITLYKLNQLHDVSALSNISPNFRGEIRLNDLPSLTTIFEMADLHTLHGTIYFNALPMLSEISSLNSISKIAEDGNLELHCLEQLYDVDFLSNIQSVDGYLGILGNWHLEDVDGLSSLTHLAGTLHVSRNKPLYELDALSNIQEFTGTLATILTWSGNPLSYCGIQHLLVDYDSTISTISFHFDSAQNATTFEWILNEVCGPYTLIGDVYLDSENNGCHDGSGQLVTDGSVEVSHSYHPRVFSSDENGRYTAVNLADSVYHFTVRTSHPSYGPSPGSFTLDIGGNSTLDSLRQDICLVPLFLNDQHEVATDFDGTASQLTNDPAERRIMNIAADDITLFPNPTSDNTMIRSSIPIHEITLYDALGQVIHRSTYEEETYEGDLPAAELRAGVYFINIQTNQGHKVMRKLMKE